MVEETEGTRKTGTKRKKYTARACHHCKRRKVKCDGEDACQQCCSRNVRCYYSPPPSSQPLSGEQAGNFRSKPSHDILRRAPETGARDHDMGPVVFSDPRVDGLSDRVQALERMLNHLLKTPKTSQDSPSGVTHQPPQRLDLSDEDGDTGNQFAVRIAAHEDLSLSSQVAAMGALLSRSPSPKPGTGKHNIGGEVLVEFPDPSALQHLFDVYFRDLDNAFPFLDRLDTEARIYNVIRRMGYSFYNRMLIVPTEDAPIVALACIMLALAESLDADKGVVDGDSKPGWGRYLQSCRALELYSNSKMLDLDVVRARCLEAAYLMHCELLSAASEAVAVTWKLATAIRLNNKRTWPVEEEQGNLQKKRLWWIIYYLDRQISRRSGTAYHIRDTEFDVDDFSVNVKAPDSISISHNDAHSNDIYLQALISTARLWAHVWDTFFAVGATKPGDWMEVEITDARILNTRRQLPRALLWNSDDLLSPSLGEGDALNIRRRLQIFTRLELLRMLIRQNPVRRVDFDPETAHPCARLSREIIKSHDLFISRFPEFHATGYFTTCSIVECIYHLAPVMRYSRDHNEHSAGIAAFDQAHGILVKVSIYNNVAKKALKALNGLVRKWGSANTTRAHTSALQKELGDFDMLNPPRQTNDFSATNGKAGPVGFDLDFGDWMNTSMGSLCGDDFDFRLDTYQ